MELRHLRCFVAVAEELHFTRAAERLHIEQSPLSRTIKALEEELGVQLLQRNSRRTHLTIAGRVLLDNARQIFSLLDQARDDVRAAASDCRRTLHIAVSENAVDARLPHLLARCREDEPEVAIRVTEVPFYEQVRGLREHAYDAGFSRSDDAGRDFIAEPIWRDPLTVLMPTQHPLVTYRKVPLEKLSRYPLILCHPRLCEGCNRQVTHLLSRLPEAPSIVETTASLSMTLAYVAAGYGVGFATKNQISNHRLDGIIVRYLGCKDAGLTTYFLRRHDTLSAELSRFVTRVKSISDEKSAS